MTPLSCGPSKLASDSPAVSPEVSSCGMSLSIWASASIGASMRSGSLATTSCACISSVSSTTSGTSCFTSSSITAVEGMGARLAGAASTALVNEDRTTNTTTCAAIEIIHQGLFLSAP